MDLFESFIKRLIFTPESVGLHGEKMIVRKLGWVQFCGKRGKILQNIYVPRENGETSEIDVLYITQKGIFVIESKNYSGYIFGLSLIHICLLPGRSPSQRLMHSGQLLFHRFGSRFFR